MNLSKCSEWEERVNELGEMSGRRSRHGKHGNRLVALVCLVYLVDLVYRVCFIQPNKQDKPNQPDKPHMRRAAFLRGSSSFSETFKSPRPVPTSMSGLVMPWKSLPPVTSRFSRLARSRYSVVWRFVCVL